MDTSHLGSGGGQGEVFTAEPGLPHWPPALHTFSLDEYSQLFHVWVPCSPFFLCPPLTRPNPSLFSFLPWFKIKDRVS